MMCDGQFGFVQCTEQVVDRVQEKQHLSHVLYRMGSSYGSIRLWWEVVENRIEVKRLPQAVTLLDAQGIVVLIVFPDRSDRLLSAQRASLSN